MDVNLIAKSLQRNWKIWPVLKRSRALNVLHLAGWSGRKLAAHVGCSEAQIRNVMLMDKLSSADKLRVAAGESMKKAIKNHKTRQKQERLTKAQKEAERGYRVIKFWFEKVEVPSSFEEQMILEILGHERGEALGRKLDWPEDNIPLDVLLEKTKPKQISTCSNIELLNAWIYWLCGFARVAIPKWEVRERALMLALSKAGGIAYKPVLH